LDRALFFVVLNLAKGSVKPNSTEITQSFLGAAMRFRKIGLGRLKDTSQLWVSSDTGFGIQKEQDPRKNQA
jgi:hypothetical protein